MPKEKTQVGVVLTFPQSMDKAEVNQMLAKWNATLPKEKRIESIQTGEFNPDWGGPVFYVP